MTLMHHGKAAALLFLLALLGGCGRSDGPSGKLAPVTGRVIYKDQGVTAAEIYFLPDADKGNNGTMAAAVLQEDGTFTMTTYPRGDGVLPGAYKVTLGLGRRNDKALEKYRKVDTTPLAFEVPEEGLTDLVIDLSNPGK